MNKFAKSLSLAAATVIMAAPFTTQASTDDAAMDACIRAFVSATLPKEQPVTVRKEETAVSPIMVHERSYKIVVSARGVESGKHLGRATCLVNRSGEVVAVNGKPVQTKLASR